MNKYIKPIINVEEIEINEVILASRNFDYGVKADEADAAYEWDSFWNKR